MRKVVQTFKSQDVVDLSYPVELMKGQLHISEAEKQTHMLELTQIAGIDETATDTITLELKLIPKTKKELA